MKKTIVGEDLILNGELLISASHRYETAKGEISMITPCKGSMGSYEIYCIKGVLFHDIERYETLEAAEQRINVLLSEEPTEADCWDGDDSYNE